jgi:hypothetical protein
MTVFVDLFFTTCGYCQQYAPIIEQIYENTGAGEGNILMWGISNKPADTDPVIDQYKTNFGITNPCAGPQGGGTAAHNTIISGQNFLGWPTYCVICPDRTMFFDPVYPPTVHGFNPYFEQCVALVNVDNELSSPETSIISIYPNPVDDILTIEFMMEESSQITLELFDLTGKSLIMKEYQLKQGRNVITMDLSVQLSGYYFLKISHDNILMDVRKLIVY